MTPTAIAQLSNMLCTVLHSWLPPDLSEDERDAIMIVVLCRSLATLQYGTPGVVRVVATPDRPERWRAG